MAAQSEPDRYGRGTNVTARAHRVRGIWILRIVLALSGASLASLVTLLAALVVFEDPVGAMRTVAKVSTAEFNYFNVFSESFIDRYPVAVSFFGGLYHGLFATIFAGRIYDRFFTPWDDEVMIPVRSPKAYDPLWGTVDESDTPSLNWVDPDRPGQRKIVWDALFEFVNRGSGDGRTRWWSGRPKSRNFVSFRWTILTGRAGAGKTRMAVELARRLAASELLESGIKADRRRRRLILLRDWWARSLPPARRKPGHLWDAGWLRHSLVAVTPDHVRGVADDPGDGGDDDAQEEVLTRLNAWRPRRPTLLLMDDPPPDSMRIVVKTLQRQREHYRHPVRLLIVDQALPAELFLRQAGVQGTRFIAGADAPLVLDGAASLAAEDVRRLAGGLNIAHVWHVTGRSGTDDQVRQFLHLTRGNPLLVELGLRWLQRDLPLADITRAALLGDRVGRLIEAFMLAGIDRPAQWRALAAATLAGPFDDSLAIREGRTNRRAILQHHFGEIVELQLGRLFNLDEPRWDGAMPPVRPELIGDAYVAHILERHCDLSIADNDARRIAAAAWQISPSGTLRTILRAIRFNSPLARLLPLEPPEGIGIDPADLALAFADAAIRRERDEDDATRISGSPPGLDAALSRIRVLSPKDAATLAERIATIMDADHRFFIINGRAGFTCFLAAVERALDDAGVWMDAQAAGRANTALQLAALRAFGWGMTYRGDEDGLSAAPIAALVGRLGQAAGYDLRRLDSATAHALQDSAWDLRRFLPKLATAILQALADMPEPNGTPSEVLQHKADVLTLRVASAVVEGDAAAASALVRQLDQLLVPSHAQHRPLAFLRAKSWALAAFAHSVVAEVEQTRFAAQQVEAIVLDSFRMIPSFVIQQAQAWRSVATACAKARDLAGCMEAIRSLDRIVLPARQDSPEFATLLRNRAEAWRDLAMLRRALGDAAGARDAARRIDAFLPAELAGHRKLAYERASAWTHVVIACVDKKDTAGALDAANTVERIVISAYQHEREFELLRVQARCDVARAMSGDVAGSEQAAREVEAIVCSRFPGNPEFEVYHASAWRHVCAALAKAERPADCAGTARKVDAIIGSRFASDPDFAIEGIWAWQCAALAYAQFGEPTQARTIVEMIDKRIRADFAGISAFAIERAKSWVNVILACERTGDRDGVLASARTIDTIACEFPEARGFAGAQLEAWRRVTFLFRETPDLDRVEQGQRRLEEIASSLAPGEPRHEIERVYGLFNLVYARLRAGQIEGACRAAQAIQDIVDPAFARDSQFAIVQAQAWRHVACALGDSGDTGGAREAAQRVAATVHPNFSGAGEFTAELTLAKAW